MTDPEQILLIFSVAIVLSEAFVYTLFGGKDFLWGQIIVLPLFLTGLATEIVLLY